MSGTTRVDQGDQIWANFHLLGESLPCDVCGKLQKRPTLFTIFSLNRDSLCTNFEITMGRATFWVIFSPTHLGTMLGFKKIFSPKKAKKCRF
jgi:hypothetical protein